MKGLATVARAIAVTLGIGFGGFMVFAVWAMNGHGADPKTFAMVTNGMTKAQVERLLGPPHWASTNYSGEHWGYGSAWKWCGMEISYSPSGSVVAKVHDH